MSNRSLRNNRRRRYAARQRGGGFDIPAFGVGNLDTNTGSFAGASTTGAGSGPGVPINTWAPANAGCDQIPRTATDLHTQANPDIAGTNQFPILGGNVPTYPFSSVVPPISNAVQFPVPDMNARQMGGSRRTHRHRRGGPCPICAGRRSQRGGGCGCMQRGGGSPQGLAQYPDALYLSGGGPNVGNPVNAQSGCGVPQGPSDVRGGNNQMGGAYMNIASAAPLDSAFPATPQPSYGAANAFPESCYKAPGSEMPVYNNNSAAFNFSPSLVENNTLPPGVNVYNDVIQQPGRMGAQRGGSRKNRKHRKHRKSTRKTNRRRH